MTKLTLSDPTTLSNTLPTTITSNNTLIEQALENTLSRDGTSPNTMEASLDMNGNDIINAENVYVATLFINGSPVTTTEIELIDIPTIMDFGAVANGITDDTDAFTAAVAAGVPVLVTPGSYYLTQNFTAPNKFFTLGGVSWTNPSNYRAFFAFNVFGNMGARIQDSMTVGREELQIYASHRGAFSTGSRGAGIHVYGNGDDEHAGNIAFMTGQNDQGTARMIISGGSSNAASGGYRTNTDTRVTIGNSIWDFVDNGEDTGLLNLKNPDGRPAIYISETSAAEGDLAVTSGDRADFGHWDGTTFTSRIAYDSTGNFEVNSTDKITPEGHFLLASYTVAGLPSASPAGQLVYVSNGTTNKRLAVSDGTNWRFPDGNIVS